MSALKHYWKPLVFLAWCIGVYVAYIRQFVPYWDSIRDVINRLTGGA